MWACFEPRALGEISGLGQKQKNAISRRWGSRNRGGKFFYHAIRDGCPQLFTFYVLPDRTPRGGKSRKTGILGHFGLWHSEKSRARTENRKTQFPGARGPESEKNVTTLSGIIVRNFFTSCVLADRTPRGGKSQNTGFCQSTTCTRGGDLRYFGVSVTQSGQRPSTG